MNTGNITFSSGRAGARGTTLVVAGWLAGIVVTTGCSSTTNTANGVAKSAQSVKNTADSITNAINAVNGATDAVQKAMHAGASMGPKSASDDGKGSLPPPQTARGARSELPPPDGAAAPSGQGRDCAIDDMSDGNNQILQAGGRAGFWYSYVDKVGSTISPPAGATFIMSPGAGANLSPFTARFMGSVGSSGIVYAGIGFTFTNPKRGYDASRYTGVSFWAKAKSGSTNVRFKVPDVNTDPDGNVCTQCFNDFGSDLVLTDQWQHFTFRFAELAQIPGWGAPRVASITPSAIYGIQWQVNSHGSTYDVAVTNVAFTGCP